MSPSTLAEILTEVGLGAIIALAIAGVASFAWLAGRTPPTERRRNRAPGWGACVRRRASDRKESQQWRS